MKFDSIRLVLIGAAVLCGGCMDPHHHPRHPDYYAAAEIHPARPVVVARPAVVTHSVVAARPVVVRPIAPRPVYHAQPAPKPHHHAKPAPKPQPPRAAPKARYGKQATAIVRPAPVLAKPASKPAKKPVKKAKR